LSVAVIVVVVVVVIIVVSVGALVLAHEQGRGAPTAIPVVIIKNT
jgi:hypothetical protein